MCGDEPTLEIFSEGGGRWSIYYGGRVKGFPLKIVGRARDSLTLTTRVEILSDG